MKTKTPGSKATPKPCLKCGGKVKKK